ncbi:WXG100 family type VII secretion target [Boudabousia marimammalium]|uniref:ESAT-6-like protein n=1 Tax=Boudabousia marimammalium TaxID=156892 RepID=A0A1Q5PJ79_9ACTO|nr:WXG100 family type VII secretion target [Boudabousia marimammalium]OKL45918.1 type VII secretion protein [Boudabousia marimammalium]
MSMFQVDSTQVAGASAAVSTSGSRLRAEVASMMTQLTALNSGWQGSAQLSFTECITQWQAVQTQVEEALDSISTRLMAASRTYEEAEAQAQSLFAR